MTYCERLCRCYQKLLENQAEQKISDIAKIVETNFQNCTRSSGMMQSAEDGELENLWEEICVQVQGERSFFWNAYVDYMESCIAKTLKEKCTYPELQMLWLQTDSFDYWSNCEVESEDCLEEFFGPDDFPVDFCEEDVITLILKRVCRDADAFSNDRIERYLY